MFQGYTRQQENNDRAGSLLPIHLPALLKLVMHIREEGRSEQRKSDFLSHVCCFSPLIGVANRSNHTSIVAYHTWQAIVILVFKGSTYPTNINIHNKKKCMLFKNCIEIVKWSMAVENFTHLVPKTLKMSKNTLDCDISDARYSTIPNSKYEPMALNASTPFLVLIKN
uniref:Uncharacterized protein n=1 Tax=Glossina pallidipes TaxID=7398 RepID=A0A1A9ZAL6_GLOPL